MYVLDLALTCTVVRTDRCKENKEIKFVTSVTSSALTVLVFLCCVAGKLT